jgi:putative transposase
MAALVLSILGALRSGLRTRADLTIENLALRQQLANLRRTSGRPRLRNSDRAFWVVLSRLWSHDRRRVLHFNVTEHPSAAWTAQQIVEAFPEDAAPRFMIRDRDCIFGDQFRRRVQSLGIEEILTAPRSPWQNPYAERLLGSVRRECLDHVIVLGERHLRRIVKSHFAYYHGSRTHLSLSEDAPEPREACPPAMGEIVERPEVGGLHHRYERIAA